MVDLGPIIPVAAGVKSPPLVAGWQTMSAAELLKAVKANMQRSPNFALRLDNYLALDPDDEAAVNLLQKMEDDGFLPPTLTWETWRGHPVRLYCARADTPKTVQYKKGVHLELRTSSGSYVLIPPSVVKGNKYRFVREMEPSLLPKDSLSELAARVQALAQKVKPVPDFDAQHDSRRLNPNIPLTTFEQGSRDNDLYTLALSLFLQGWSRDGVSNACLAVARGCRPPFPDKEVHIKVQSAWKAALQKAKPVAAMVREWINDLAGDGAFTVNDIIKELALEPGRKTYTTVYQALTALRQSNDIVPVGSKRGVFRKVNNDAPVLDILSAAVSPMDLRWPLGLHKAINFYPGNLAVFAGETNSGKTAYLLNFVMENLEQWGGRIRYLSSEGGVQELRSRLNLFSYEFGIPIEKWLCVDWRERYDNFQDIIHPHWINIVDYLEVNDEFWKIGEPLKEISKKLDTGIAVIAVQKKRGERLGRGGDFGTQRPRLYCTLGKDPKNSNLILRMEKGKAKISDAFDTNGGYRITFRIRNGCKLEKIQEEMV